MLSVGFVFLCTDRVHLQYAQALCIVRVSALYGSDTRSRLQPYFLLYMEEYVDGHAAVNTAAVSRKVDV